LIHALPWLLAVAATIGIVMAVIRFAKEKAAPGILSKAHCFLNCSGLALLVCGWATVGSPKLASTHPPPSRMDDEQRVFIGQTHRHRFPIDHGTPGSRDRRVSATVATPA
jgi:hypothetical protein